MSVTFTISGERANYEAVADGAKPNYANFANANAVDLLRWLGFEVDASDGDLYGVLLPGDLRARCLRRLAETPDNVASDLPRATVAIAANRVVCGQPAGSKARRTRELLELAERAGDRAIEYS